MLNLNLPLKSRLEVLQWMRQQPQFQRDQNCQIREKRGDTLVGTVRQEYGDNFAKGYRSDAKLETVRQKTGEKLE